MEPLDPRRTALLLLDLQRGVLPSVPDADALVRRVAGVLAWARGERLAVRHVRLSLDQAARTAIPARNMMFARFAGSSLFAAGSDGTAFPDALAPAPDERVHDKTRVGVFATTTLHGDLAAAGIDTLLLAGIHTSGVILSTVREAADRDYRTIVAADLCADPDAATHEFLIERIFPRQAHVVTMADIVGG